METPWTPKVGSARPVFFFDQPKIRLEVAGIEGSAHQLQCAILAVQPCARTMGRREARPLVALSPPRATASPWGPKSSRPEAPTHSSPSQSELEPKASPSKTTRNDSTRPKTSTVRNVQKRSPQIRADRRAINNEQRKCFPLPLAQSQGHRQPPNCSPEADHSHGCRPMCLGKTAH